MPRLDRAGADDVSTPLPDSRTPNLPGVKALPVRFSMLL